MWTQWCADTAALLAALPSVLPQDAAAAATAGGAGGAGPLSGGGVPPPGTHQAMLLTLERWLLLLKVRRLGVMSEQPPSQH